MPTVLLVLNVVVAVVSVGFGVLALIRPSALSGTASSESGTYFAQMYAARAIPLGIAVVIGLLTDETSTLVAVLLVAAAAAQLGDVVIGIRRRVVGMIAGGAVVAIVHVIGAVWVLSS